VFDRSEPTSAVPRLYQAASISTNLTVAYIGDPLVGAPRFVAMMEIDKARQAWFRLARPCTLRVPGATVARIVLSRCRRRAFLRALSGLRAPAWRALFMCGAAVGRRRGISAHVCAR